jgi:hypothetical protein
MQRAIGRISAALACVRVSQSGFSSSPQLPWGRAQPARALTGRGPGCDFAAYFEAGICQDHDTQITNIKLAARKGEAAREEIVSPRARPSGLRSFVAAPDQGQRGCVLGFRWDQGGPLLQEEWLFIAAPSAGNLAVQGEEEARCCST